MVAMEFDAKDEKIVCSVKWHLEGNKRQTRAL